MSTLLGFFLVVFPLTPNRLGLNTSFLLVMSFLVIGQFRISLFLTISLYSRSAGCPTVPCSSCAIFSFPHFVWYSLQIFPYFLNGHYFRLCIYRFHLVHSLSLSWVALEVGISPSRGRWPTLIYCHSCCCNHNSLVVLCGVCWIYPMGWSSYPYFRLVPAQDGLFALILWYVAKSIFRS